MVFSRDRLDVEIETRDVASDMPFIGVYFVEKDDEESHGILAIRGHRMNPIIAPRWQSGVNAYESREVGERGRARGSSSATRA